MKSGTRKPPMMPSIVKRTVGPNTTLAELEVLLRKLPSMDENGWGVGVSVVEIEGEWHVTIGGEVLGSSTSLDSALAQAIEFELGDLEDV